jgi:hypothetical protein
VASASDAEGDASLVLETGREQGESGSSREGRVWARGKTKGASDERNRGDDRRRVIRVYGRARTGMFVEMSKFELGRHVEAVARPFPSL